MSMRGNALSTNVEIPRESGESDWVSWGRRVYRGHPTGPKGNSIAALQCSDTWGSVAAIPSRGTVAPRRRRHRDGRSWRCIGRYAAAFVANGRQPLRRDVVWASGPLFRLGRLDLRAETRLSVPCSGGWDVTPAKKARGGQGSRVGIASMLPSLGTTPSVPTWCPVRWQVSRSRAGSVRSSGALPFRSP